MSDVEDFGEIDAPELRDPRRPRRKPTKSLNYKEAFHRNVAIQKRIDQKSAENAGDEEARANLERLNVEHKRQKAAQKRHQAKTRQANGRGSEGPEPFRGVNPKLRVDYRGMLETLLKKAE